MKYEIRFVGSGGQGVITAAVVLAEAAANMNLHVMQRQVYSPEARGSICRSEVIISEERILFPQIEIPDILVLLTQEACDRYAGAEAQYGRMLTDLALSVSETKRIVRLPIFAVAEKHFGKNQCVNMLILGALNELWPIVPEEELYRAVKLHLPESAWEDGITACRIGAALAQAG